MWRELSDEVLARPGRVALSRRFGRDGSGALQARRRVNKALNGSLPSGQVLYRITSTGSG
jgi:hypothetical protein